MYDMWVLDVLTETWLRVAGDGFWPMRGGVNAAVCAHGHAIIFGGMHSDPGAVMPTFKGNAAALCVELDYPSGGTFRIRCPSSGQGDRDEEDPSGRRC